MEEGILFILFVLLGIVVGSKLLYAATQYRYIPYLFKKAEFSLWIRRAKFIFGGSVFYGGLVGGLLVGYIRLKATKKDISLYSDMMAPIIPLFHGITRVGCFFAGCCYGIPCEFGFTVHNNNVVPSVNGVVRFPVQLLESFANLLLAAVIFLLLNKAKSSRYLSGNLLKIYLISYGVIRFLDEFLRGDEYRGFIGIFSISQWISLFMIVLNSVLLVRSITRIKKAKSTV